MLVQRPMSNGVIGTIKSRARTLGWRVSPGLMSDRARRYTGQLRLSHGILHLARRFTALHGPNVQGGPFAGMYHPLAAADMPVSKLLGCYEAELHDAVHVGIRLAPPTFIDLGCADGYYAVGFARASPTTFVHAFDVSKSARRACRALAEANGVADRISLHSKATTRALRRLPLEDSVVLCDVDGAELDIFRGDAVDNLRSALVIVELHERTRPGVDLALLSRFGPSHSCEIISAKPRDPLDYPELATFSEAERDLAVDELRWRTDGLRWAVFAPRQTVPA
jgi:hypothetical protein